jgi:outer membrane protein OmpA-like peptidoglycan-associated protein
MRRNARVTCIRTVMIGSVIVCLVFGQATRNRQDTDALRLQAEAAANRGEWSEAASSYRSAISWDRNSAWAYLGLADVYRANGVWDKAAEQYNAAAKIAPADTRTKDLASLSQQALAESREGFVKASTFRAMAEFPWSWLRNSDQQSRDLEFQPKALTTTTQRIPIQPSFPRDKFTLDSLPQAAALQLEELAAMIHASTVRPLKIEVEGHTCRCGSDAANRELGRKRAEAIRGFLIARGAAAPDDITAISYGSSRPVESAGAPSLPAAVCDRDEIHSQNRRVVIGIYTQGNVLTKTPSPLSVSFLSAEQERTDTSGSPTGVSSAPVTNSQFDFTRRRHSTHTLFIWGQAGNGMFSSQIGRGRGNPSDLRTFWSPVRRFHSQTLLRASS